MGVDRMASGLRPCSASRPVASISRLLSSLRRTVLPAGSSIRLEAKSVPGFRSVPPEGGAIVRREGDTVPRTAIPASPATAASACIPSDARLILRSALAEDEHEVAGEVTEGEGGEEVEVEEGSPMPSCRGLNGGRTSTTRRRREIPCG
jgi:hypothetical protein